MFKEQARRRKVPGVKRVRGRIVGDRVRELAGLGHVKPCKPVKTLAFPQAKRGAFSGI